MGRASRSWSSRPGSAERLLEIDETLERLQSVDPRKHQALEMSVFGGLTHAEIATALDVSVPTIEGDLRMARLASKRAAPGALSLTGP